MTTMAGHAKRATRPRHALRALLLAAPALLLGCRFVEPDAHPDIPEFPELRGDPRVYVEQIAYEGETIEDVTHDGDATVFVLSIVRGDLKDRSRRYAPGPVNVRVYKNGTLTFTYHFENHVQMARLRKSTHVVEVKFIPSRRAHGPTDGMRLIAPYDGEEYVEALNNVEFTETWSFFFVDPRFVDQEPGVISCCRSEERADARIVLVDEVAVERLFPASHVPVGPEYRVLRYFRVTLEEHVSEFKVNEITHRRRIEFMGLLPGDPGLWIFVEDGPDRLLYTMRVR